MSPAANYALMAPAMVQSEIAVVSWYKGEFAAANAIIDALCNHIKEIGGGESEYEAAFAAIHRRRMSWIPVIQMQKHFSIADVTLELRKVAAERKGSGENAEDREIRKSEVKDMMQREESGNSDGNGGLIESVDDDSSRSEVTDTGSQEMQINVEHHDLCDNHEECGSRQEMIKLTKDFIAKEPIKGNMVNVVKGLKMYEDIFTDREMCKLNELVNELRAAGRNGELSGETYVLFNKEMKGSKREQVQLGTPIFGHIQDEASSQKQQKTTIETIPALLQSVIDHLAQWNIISETRRPNGCIINYFDEGEYSQPFLKPPHLDHTIFTLMLSESTMAFGRTLVDDGEGVYKGSLILPVKQGSVLVMRNKSAEVARHVMCSSPSKRVSITFYRVHNSTPRGNPMPLWRPENPMPRGAISPMVPGWGFIHPPMVTFSPMGPVIVRPNREVPRGGTGVFLPWESRQRKHTKQYPPRAQKGRFLGLNPGEAHPFETMSDPGFENKVV